MSPELPWPILWNLEDRGPIFIEPQTEVYEGMVIGEHLKGSDLVVNPTKNKQLTNMRAFEPMKQYVLLLLESSTLKKRSTTFLQMNM